MKKNNLLWLLTILLLTYNANSQTLPGVYPSVLDDGCKNSIYSDTSKIVFVADTLYTGFTIPIDSVLTTGFSNLPSGITATCLSSSCTTTPPGVGLSGEINILFNGIPLTSISNNVITIYHTYWITAFGSPTSLYDSSILL